MSPGLSTRVNPWPPIHERHGSSVLLLELAILVSLVIAWTAGQPLTTTTLALFSASVLTAARITVDERAYRLRQPRMRLALKRTGTAVGRLIRRRLMFRDIPAAQPSQLFITIRELALGLGRPPDWSPAETTTIREGIEIALLAFEAEVGRQVPNLPPAAAKRIDEVADGLDQCAELLLRVTDAANDVVTARWSEDANERKTARDALGAAVEAALAPLRAAHSDCEWLIYAADA